MAPGWPRHRAPEGGVIAACTATGGLLWWTAARSISARKGVAHAERVRGERDSALRTLNDLIAMVDEGRGQIRWALDRAKNGDVRTDFEAPEERRPTGDVRSDAVAALTQGLTESWQAVVTAAAHTEHKLNSQAELAEIFKSVVPQLQGLVNRGITAITEVELAVEDPDHLHQLFQIDHLLTQMRRAAESLAVLGGNSPSRNTKPITITEAIRSAVSEIPHYPRVRVALSQVTAAVPGYVSPNLVHLLAALMENATVFSPPPTRWRSTPTRRSTA